ncbi:hypothetical protein QQ045_028187 [Rhodiola kirilowii]
MPVQAANHAVPDLTAKSVPDPKLAQSRANNQPDPKSVQSRMNNQPGDWIVVSNRKRRKGKENISHEMGSDWENPLTSKSNPDLEAVMATASPIKSPENIIQNHVEIASDVVSAHADAHADTHADDHVSHKTDSPVVEQAHTNHIAQQPTSPQGTINCIKSMLAHHNYSVCGFLGTKACIDKLPNFANSISFNNYMDNGLEISKIWVLWRDGITLNMISASHQHITVEIDPGPGSTAFLCSFVYAANAYVDRRLLWEDLLDISHDLVRPWLVVGDFNTISSWTEKKGGDHSDGGAMIEFNEFQIQAGLGDAGYIGNKYTWCNNQEGDAQIWTRLDRLLVNGRALAMLPDLQVHHLARVASDHCPLCISLGDNGRRCSTFKYLHVWHDHLEFLDTITEAWQHDQHQNPIMNITLKLKRLRQNLKKWNWDVFGNIHIRNQ